MSIYRTPEGEELLRGWCQAAVDEGPWRARRSIETSLGPTHVAVVGEGSPSVLWLPGTNFNAAVHASLAAQAGRSCTFHVVDLPGQPGLSSSDDLGRDRMARYGPWVIEVVQQVADEPMIVAGHSLGAAVALSAAPSPSIAALALFGPAGLAKVRITPTLLTTSIPWMVRPSAANATRLLRYMQHPSSPVDDQLVEWLALVSRHTKQVGAPGPLSSEDLARWRSKVTVITGAGDRFFPPERLVPRARQLLDAAVDVVGDSGHLVPDEQPDRVIQILLDLATEHM